MLTATTVLLVADDVASCALLGTLLLKHLGCSARGATSMEAALEMMATERIDTVLLVTRGGAEGADRFQALLGPAEPASIPVMVVALGGDLLAHLDFLQQGAADVVAFPCPGPEILARVRRLLLRTARNHSRKSTRRYSLAGDLSGLSLTDLVALLDYISAYGVLHLFTPRGTGKLSFRRGQVSHAEFENLEGRAAFFELLREQEAQFEFVPGDGLAGGSRGALEGSSVALLLEGARSLDERTSSDSGATLVKQGAGEDREHPSRAAPAFAPDPETAAEWIAAFGQITAPAEIHLLNRIQIRSWTGAHPGTQRLKVALVTDVACGVQVFEQLASPLGKDQIVRALERPPQTIGLSWSLPGDRTLEILLLDQDRLSAIVDCVLGCPAVLIVAPSYGDFMTLDVTARSALQSLLERVPPLLVLGVGNGALQTHLADFLRFVHAEVPQYFVRGSLWKLDPSPRVLVEEAIRLWAELPSPRRSEAA